MQIQLLRSLPAPIVTALSRAQVSKIVQLHLRLPQPTLAQQKKSWKSLEKETI